jgi:hypothetical protein
MTLMLDHLDGFSLTDEQAKAHTNAFNTANRMMAGLRFLYDLVAAEEQRLREKSDPNRMEMTWPASGVATNIPVDNLFDWYSVQACALVRLIGKIAYMEGSPETHYAYSKRVCGPVETYRNKIGAHLAWTDPRKDDNPIDLKMTLMPNTGWMDGRFRTQLMVLHETRSGVSHSPSHDYAWCLTKFHEEVILPRYGKR